jgi:hypothetical protein
MAHPKLSSLGDERYKSICTQLMNGVRPLHLVRLIKDNWGQYPETSAKTLFTILTRHREQLRENKAKAAIAQEAGKIHIQNLQSSSAHIQNLQRSSLQVLGRLIGVADLQIARAERLYAEELKLTRPIPGLSGLINDYRDTLINIQKIQFDLGVNEFKGPMSGMRGVIDKRTLPDGTHQERHVYEAVAAVEEIFRKRGINMEHPQLSEGGE